MAKLEYSPCIIVKTKHKKETMAEYFLYNLDSREVKKLAINKSMRGREFIDSETAVYKERSHSMKVIWKKVDIHTGETKIIDTNNRGGFDLELPKPQKYQLVDKDDFPRRYADTDTKNIEYFVGDKGVVIKIDRINDEIKFNPTNITVDARYIDFSFGDRYIYQVDKLKGVIIDIITENKYEFNITYFTYVSPSPTGGLFIMDLGEIRIWSPTEPDEIEDFDEGIIKTYATDESVDDYLFIVLNHNHTDEFYLFSYLEKRLIYYDSYERRYYGIDYVKKKFIVKPLEDLKDMDKKLKEFTEHVRYLGNTKIVISMTDPYDYYIIDFRTGEIVKHLGEEQDPVSTILISENIADINNQLIDINTGQKIALDCIYEMNMPFIPQKEKDRLSKDISKLLSAVSLTSNIRGLISKFI